MLRNCPDKLLYDITFACRLLCGKQMTACEQIRLCAVVVDCFIVSLGLVSARPARETRPSVCVKKHSYITASSYLLGK